MENNLLELFAKLFAGQSNQPPTNPSPYYPSQVYPTSQNYQEGQNYSTQNMSSLMPLLLSLMGGGNASMLSKTLPEPLASLMSLQQKSSPQSSEQTEKNVPHDEIIL